MTEAVEEFLAGGHGETFTFRGAEAGGHVLFGNVQGGHLRKLEQVQAVLGIGGAARQVGSEVDRPAS